MIHAKPEPQQEREFWWVHSDKDEYWAGTRIAVFLPVKDVELAGRDQAVIILGDGGDRMGVRVWSHIQDVEGWRRVKRIDPPTSEEMDKARK
jgi:hypothetical protein